MNKEATKQLERSYSKAVTPWDLNFYSATDQYGNRHTTCTAVTYGNQIHLTRFNQPIRLNVQHKRSNYAKAKVTTRRANNINRAKRQVYRLVMSNFKQQPIRTYQNPVWATFTYPDSAYAKITNRESHLKDFTEYFRRLRRRYGKDIRYLAVMELTQKGNVHFHVIIFNLPKFESSRELAQIWLDLNAGQGRICSHGGQDIKRLPWGYKKARRTAEDIAGYLSKYLAKTFQDLDYSNVKLYLPSQNLEQPIRHTNPDEVREVLIKALEKGYFITYTSKEYELPFIGTIRMQTLEPET